MLHMNGYLLGHKWWELVRCSAAQWPWTIPGNGSDNDDFYPTLLTKDYIRFVFNNNERIKDVLNISF